MKKSKGIVILVIILIALIIIAGVLLFFKITGTQMKNEDLQYEMQAQTKTQEDAPEIVEMKEPQIFKGTDRPIAIMIDNHKGALPQGGLNDAYLVYEIIVEGGESRLMALFKGKDEEKIGPVRSARH